ncbi:MAG TPA: outer membrane beta-barrel protein [Gammaproteobacteria bacterium]
MDGRGIAPALAAAALAVAAAGAAAQEPGTPRGDYEFAIVVPHLDAESTPFDGGTVVSTESATGLGFNFDYAFATRWTVGARFTFHEVDYVADVAVDGPLAPGGTRLDGELEATSLLAHAKRYFGDFDRVAPYASFGVGVTSVDTNIPEGAPVGFCWWHPWWGYVCDSVQPTKTDTDMSAALRFGVRWAFGRRLFLDANVGRQWIDFDTADRPGFSELAIAVGFLR